MKIVKVTSKGQITIPAQVRAELGIDDGSYVEIEIDDGELRMRPLVRSEPLAKDDPIWKLVGAGHSGRKDVSKNHDRHLAEAEMERWRSR